MTSMLSDATVPLLQVGALSPLADPQALLTGLGPWAMVGMGVIVFIESGVLFPLLPGDSLLFTAGLLHSSLGVPLVVVMVVAFVAAFLGDQVGYLLGHRFGRGLFSEQARFLKSGHLRRAEDFFTRYGGRALVLARFVPVVRTYVPLVAGMARLPYRRFLGWNALGAALWSIIMITAGALLGGVPFVTGHVELIALGLVGLSLVPVGVQLLRSMRTRAADRPADQPEEDTHRRVPALGNRT
jgi:membrane-associated protein